MKHNVIACMAILALASAFALGLGGCAAGNARRVRAIEAVAFAAQAEPATLVAAANPAPWPEAAPAIAKSAHPAAPELPELPARHQVEHAAAAAESADAEAAGATHRDGQPGGELNAAGKASLRRLIDGNRRFKDGKQASKPLGGARRKELTAGQHPFAAVLCCSDSRVPPELIFDQGLGDLFIIRVAGNVADPVVTGSIEYAAEHLGVPLIVVLGHEQCGAVKATVEGGEAPGSIGSLVEKIQPAVASARAEGPADKGALVERAVEANVEQWVTALKDGPIVGELTGHGKTAVVGAKYHLATGEVSWH